MKATKVILFTGLLLTTLAAEAWGSSLQLRDGEIIQGKYLGGTETNINFQVNGNVQVFPVSKVLLLDFSGSTTNSTAPATPSSALPAPPAKPATSAQQAGLQKVTVPAGTEIEVRMTSSISAGVNEAGNPFKATLNNPLVENGVVVAPKDAMVYGKLVQSKASGEFRGTSELSLELTGIEINGSVVPVSTSDYVQAGNSRGKQTVERTGIGAGLGALIGAIAGGGKGAAIGAAVGGGAGAGSQVITHGKQINIPSESVLAFTLAQPLTVSLPKAK